jgi:predicted nucleic acid-binding protein
VSHFVVDASVAIKWFLPEVHGEAALRLLEDDHNLLVPDLLFPEIGNALWKRVRRGEATPEEANATLEAFVSLPLEVYPSPPLLPPALEIACRVRRSVYDSLYLAVAVLRQCQMVTADRRFHNALKNGPFSANLLWVADIP